MLAFKRLICAVDATKQIINEWWDDKSSTVDIIILPPDIVDLLTHDDEVKDNDVMIDFFFFLSGFFFSRTLTTHRTVGEGRGPSYSTLPLPPAHEHSDINLQLCTWDDYHILLIATLVFTRLLLDEIYNLIELLFDRLMM